MVFSEERIEISGKTVLWHKSCFSSYTSRKNLASVQLGMEESEERTVETTNVSSNTESSGRPATRMSLDATVNWELCLFCQQVSYKKDRKLYKVVTYDTCTNIKAAAERQQDQRILTIVSHDEFVLIPYEGKYHILIYDWDIDASVASTYRKEKLKNRLVKHYGTKIVFQPQLNPSLPELVFSSGVKLQDVINTASKLRQDVEFQDVEDEFHTTCTNEAERILYLAAKILQKELQATVGIQYSPVNPDEISQDNAEAIVPNKLFSFLHLLMTPNKNSDEISIDKEFSRTDNENFHRLVLSVGQDMVYISSEGKKHTPKHVELSMSLLHLIRSKTILTMLNRQGHCVSYDEA